MRRLFFLLCVSLNLAQPALAQQDPSPPPAQLPSPPPDDGRLPAYLSRKFGLAKEKALQISNAVDLAAAKYSLPPAMLLAIISIESRFKEKARGSRGATGLMQVVPSAHRNLLRNTKDLTEPGTNIDTGSAILYGYLKSAGGDVNAALKKYGGSQAYAERIQKRTGEFTQVVAPPVPLQADAPAASAPSANPAN
ncbi:transglycosylase SLT domain-containing protein [Burkholderia alba]|uniref:transglycosylase SLT domain-containing protein n=1 Tax=Burkholderia alba TaxID=2683677 RepID=UPI003898EAFA